MLQYHKRSASAKNQTKNFLAINKSLVTKNKSNHLPKINSRKEDQQKRTKFTGQHVPGARPPAMNNRDKPPKLPAIRKPPSATQSRSNNHHHKKSHEETVTISKDYLEKLLKGVAAGGISAPVPQQALPYPTATQHQPQQVQVSPPMYNPVVSQPTQVAVGAPAPYNQGSVVYDHSQVPGLCGSDQSFHSSPPQHYHHHHHTAAQHTVPVSSTVKDGSCYTSLPSGGIVTNTSLDTSPSQGGGGGTYHRGTTNRPLHPAMRSQISFGVGPGWGEDGNTNTYLVDQQRDEAKRKWLNELGEQVKSHNTPTTHTSPVSKPIGMSQQYPPQIQMPVSQNQSMNTCQPHAMQQGAPGIRREDNDIDICLMKANNVQNPTSVAGRGGGGHVSVGLQEQMSPREFNEKKRKDLEHRDYLLAQMEEKRRLKEEEKMKIEREAAIEERRLALERERMAREFEMEKEMQKRKKMEEAKRISHLEQRIKMAEKSAIAAKDNLKRSKRQHSNSNSKHVAFHSHSNSHHSYEDDIPPLNTDELYLEGVKTSVDLRSPSLHTIPISASQSDKSVTSPRNSYDKHHKTNTRSSKTSVPSHHHHHHVPVVASNSQVSLYSSSSEEPATKRRPKPKPEPPSSGKKPSGPAPRESRIPRKSILRKQLGKNLNQNKSESESDGNKVPHGVARRTVTANGHQSQQHQVPNSVVKKSMTRPRAASSHKGQHHSSNRPPSNDSETEHIRHSKNRRLNKAQSVSQGMEAIPDPLPPSSSPPVPAVARRLKEQETRTSSPPVPAVAKHLKEEENRTSSLPVPAVAKRSKDRTTSSPPVPVAVKHLKKGKTHSASPPVPAVTARHMKEESDTQSPPVPAGTRSLQEEQFRTTSPPVPAVARCLKEQEQQVRTSSPPVPAVAKRLAEEKAKLEQNDGLSLNNGVKVQENVLPNISVTLHDSPQANSHKSKVTASEFEFPPVVQSPPQQQQHHNSPPQHTSSIPSLPPVSTTTGIISHQPHISDPLTTPQTSIASEPLPPIDRAPPHSNTNHPQTSNTAAQPLPPIAPPHNTVATQPQQTPPTLPPQEYSIYSQTTIPSFEHNHQSAIAPPTNTVVQYVRAPSYPPDNDHVKPAVRRHPHNHHHWEERRVQRNAVCVLPTIEEVRSQEEMKESASNKSLHNAVQMCRPPGHVANHKEIAAELLKLKQGIQSHMRSFQSSISSTLAPQNK